jgi:hypothetical protein
MKARFGEFDGKWKADVAEADDPDTRGPVFDFG